MRAASGVRRMAAALSSPSPSLKALIAVSDAAQKSPAATPNMIPSRDLPGACQATTSAAPVTMIRKGTSLVLS